MLNFLALSPRNRTAVILLTAVLHCSVTAAVAGDLEVGRAAIDSGDYGRAVELLLPLAKAGDPVAQNAIGVLYMNGWGVEQDPGQGVQWFRMSADQGEPGGFLNLACAYRKGTGVERSCRQARDLLLDCAGRGDSRCQTDLGELLATGCPDLAPNQKEALKWTKAAADQGDSLAMGNLAASYATGQGVKQDYKKAIAWYERAAAAGNALAAYNLAGMYERGEGVKKDAAAARRWYETAASSGHRGAQLRVELLDVDSRSADTFDPEVLHFALGGAPADVVMAYTSMKMIEGFLPMAEMGANLVLGDEVVTSKNVDKLRKRLEKRIGAIELAIEKRGVRQVAGSYQAHAADCARSGSLWAGAIAEGFGEVLISQDGAAIQLTVKGSHEGEPLEITAQGYVVEDAVALTDPMNSDYPLSGSVSDDGGLEIRPVADLVLQAWPGWARPPARADVEGCVVTLRRAEDR
jgi:TPR repeat protein